MAEDERLSLRIKDWIESASGWFHTRDLDNELGIVTTGAKAHRRLILFRLVAQGVISRDLNKNGIYKVIQSEADDLDWINADTENVLPMSLPANLENLVNIYPKNIIVVAGSPDAGKTAFLLNVIKLNMCQFDTWYFNSEMGKEELKLRISKFDLPMEDWSFHAKARSSNFSDVVCPTGLNVIDFLEVTTDFYRIGQEITEIFNALTSGIAVIALQKKRGAELGRGAEFSLEKPRLYLAMDSGTLTIQKAKNWVDPFVNPNKMEFTFTLYNGCDFRFARSIQ